MKQLIGYAVAALCLLATQAAAAPVTYYIQSEPYESVSNFTACPLGGCTATYTTSQRVSGSITFVAPFEPNLADEDVDVRIDSFSISDGQNTYTDAQFFMDVFAQSARVSTDSAGNLTAFEFKFDKTNGQPYGELSYADPKAKVSYIWISSAPAPGMVVAASNSTCQLRGDNGNGNTGGAGCMMAYDTDSQGASSASATGVTLSLTPPPSPVAVPTMSEWAMILLAALLGAGAVTTLNRRRTIR